MVAGNVDETVPFGEVNAGVWPEGNYVFVLYAFFKITIA